MLKVWIQIKEGDMNNKYINKEMKTAITASWKSDSCCLFEIQSKNRQSLTTAFSDKSKTSEAKFNEKLYQTAKIWKTKLQTEQFVRSSTL